MAALVIVGFALALTALAIVAVASVTANHDLRVTNTELRAQLRRANDELDWWRESYVDRRT